MEELKSQIERNPPDHLYHYTSIGGLQGILGSRCLWASSIHFLNDTQEITYAISILNRVFDDYRDKYPESPIFRMALRPPEQEIALNPDEALRRLYDWLADILPELLLEHFQICVFSLSERGDLLSQWRGYCPAGGGYSIGFRRDLLIATSKSQDFYLEQCVYDESKQEAIIDRDIKKLTESFLKTWPDSKSVPLVTVDEMIHMIVPDFCVEFTKTAALIKHNAFEEEREWRMISRPVSPRDFAFRVGESMMIPYIPIKFGDSELFPVDEIMVGPASEQSLAVNSLRNYLRSKDLKIEVNASDIPYREL